MKGCDDQVIFQEDTRFIYKVFIIQTLYLQLVKIHHGLKWYILVEYMTSHNCDTNDFMWFLSYPRYIILNRGEIFTSCKYRVWKIKLCI